MSQHNSRRWAARAALISAAAIAFSAFSAAAYAEDNDVAPDFGFTVSSDIKIGAAGSDGAAVPIYVFGNRAVKPVLTIDVAGLASLGTVELPDTCPVAGAKATCKFADGMVEDVIPLVIHPTAAAGHQGSFTVTSKADNVAERSSTSKVTLVDGVDMVAIEPYGNLGNAKPGEDEFMPMAFGNAGNRTATGATVTMWFDHGVVPFQYDGCGYAETPVHGTLVTCPVDQALPPGTALRWVTVDEHGNEIEGFGVGFAADAYGMRGVGFVIEATGETDVPPSALAGKKAAGGRHFKLKAAASKFSTGTRDVNDENNLTEASYHVLNTVDRAAIGATARGKVGDVVTVTIGAKNNGPATLDATRSDGPAATFTFVPPPGVEVVKAPGTCFSVTGNPPVETGAQPGAPGGKFYRCFTTSYFAAGDTVTVPFDLKITEVIDDASGTVSFDDPYRNPPADSNPSNDKALVVINPTASGGGTGGLPVTGFQVGLTAGAGLALLTAGFVLYLVARRRRLVMVAGDDEVGA